MAAKFIVEGGKICRPRDQGKDYMTPHQTFMVSHIKYNPNRSLAPNYLLTDLGLICLNCLRYEWTSPKKVRIELFWGGHYIFCVLLLSIHHYLSEILAKFFHAATLPGFAYDVSIPLIEQCITVGTCPPYVTRVSTLYCSLVL